MANKKPRTPMPPRNVQAPRRRDTKSPTSSILTEVPAWIWFASVGLVAGALILIFVLQGSGSSSDAKAAMLAAGCTFEDVAPKPPKKDKGNTVGGYHADVPTLKTPTKGLWSTDPPTAGAHYAAWAVWGFYRAPVNPRQVVHNEEHGGVIIWWGPKVPSSTVDQLEAFYNQSPDAMFGTPYAPLGDKIALTAWTGDYKTYYHPDYGMGHLAKCSTFDQKAFAAFRSAYRGKGPEGAQMSQDKPGTGPQ